MNLREKTLRLIVQQMKDPQRGLSIKDRTFHFHVFSDCFVGNEFVTWTLFNGVVDTRQQATMLGQDLLDRGIIFHASNDQPFRDGYFFYTFQNFPEITEAELDIIVMRMKAHPTGVSIQDRTHHLRTYRDCFVGAEAVDWFVKNVPKYALSRQTAIKLGQELMNKGLVHSGTQQPFSDGIDFYFFQKPIHAGYLGKLNKTGTEWKIRWFSVRDAKERKLWYYNSPRDPVPRDFISLEDACLRVALDQEVGFMEIVTNLRTYFLRATSSTLLSRWVECLSTHIGTEGCEDNLRIERAEYTISGHECGIAAAALAEVGLCGVGLSPEEIAVMDGGLEDGIGLIPAIDQEGVPESVNMPTTTHDNNPPPDNLDAHHNKDEQQADEHIPTTTTTMDFTSLKRLSSVEIPHEYSRSKEEENFIEQLTLQLEATTAQDCSFVPPDSSLFPPAYDTDVPETHSTIQAHETTELNNFHVI